MNGEVLFPSEKRIDAIGQNGGDDNYSTLRNVLDRAFEQASSGKGQERHGQNLPFDKQPMQQIQDLVGEGFALGQAIKKMQESQRLSHDAAIRELLGAINYIAGVIIHKERELFLVFKVPVFSGSSCGLLYFLRSKRDNAFSDKTCSRMVDTIVRCA